MSNTEIMEKISLLSDELKHEASDFIDYLLEKKMKINKNHPKAGV